jgi:signal peptidase I
VTTENDFQTPDAAPDPAPGPWSARPTPPPPPAHSWRDIRDDLADWARTLFSAGVYAVLIITFVGQVARVEGSSMEPTLHDQDRLVVNKIAYLLHDPTIGDIVMHYYPKDPDLTFVKRIIAGPGDMVEIKGGQVYRNGEMVKDDYVDDNMRSHEDEPAQFVSDGHYFVMGDHRNNSLDSRAWGLLPAKYILGKVELRWWPLDRAKIFSP